jgi:hypothetical protein
MFLMITCFAFVQTTFAQETPQQEPAEKLISDVVGKWTLTKVLNGKKDITGQKSATGIQRIELTREAKFVMSDKKQQLDSGLFRVNESQKTIYFESKTGGDTPPSEWGIDLHNNQMILTSRAAAHSNGYKYIYTRTSLKGK